MARRKSSGTGMNLDSLMDTLTNVVGFLIMLMVLMMLGVGDAVKRIKEANPELGGVSVQELADMRMKAEDLRKLLDELKIKWEPIAPKADDMRLELEKLQALLPDLKEEAKDLPPTSPAQEKEKLLQEQLKKEKELRDKVLATQEELAKLRAMLAETPERHLPPPKRVSLPDPRDPPKGARPIYFFCRNGEIYPVDVDNLRKLALTTVKRVPGAVNKDGTVDCDKVVELVNSKAIGDRVFMIRMEVSSNFLHMRLEPRKGAGETLEQMLKPASTYQRMARKAQQDGNFARFYVWNDSYDLYLEARKICDSIGLPAGWDPFYPNFEWKNRLHEIKCFDPNPPPPPPPKPATPPPPSQPKPPLPVDLID